ncbi:MAG: pyruvate/2-oxoglutarate dehydrogenase complex, dihydrolipoamide dehydrogenase component [Planctomycetota bacterium]|nr:pyruvate/2-oxoglutarate dehydrogenase complex, dihydrolipoamide dehydrogenase component [Planctomycetota bacterium]
MYDLVVIGGGAGGVGVAVAAAKVGARVALIEKARLGGESTHTAGIPTQALLKAAQVAHRARKSSIFGIQCGPVTIDFAAVMSRVRSLAESLSNRDSEESLRSTGIDVFPGTAAFEAYDSVVIDGKTRVSGSRFVIATGSRSAIPEIPGLRESAYLTSETIWGIDELPESLAILGAGPVGLELGQAFARLGSKVTILETDSEILSEEDPDGASELRQRLCDEGITFFTDIEVTGVGPKDGKTLIKFRSKREGSTYEAMRSHLLVATGRLANIEGLNLEAVGIHATPEQGIPVNEYLVTESPHIYAIGDVTGRDRYTHAAEREASIVFQNAVLRLSKKFRDDAMPRTTFTDPQFASVGMTEKQARHDHPNCRVFQLDLAGLERARIDAAGGIAKVLTSESGKILGATIVGEDASLVLQEFVLAIEHNLSLNDLSATMQPFPTMASVIRSLASQFGETRLEKGFVKTALRWLYGFDPGRRAVASPIREQQAEHK